MVQDEDNFLERSLLELGEPIAEFAVRPWRFWTRLVLSLLLMAYGLFANYYWWVIGPQKFNHFSFILLFVPPGMGVSLFWLVLASRGLNILIYPTGLLRLQRSQIESYPWPEVEEIRIKADTATITTMTNEAGELINCWLLVNVPTFQLWNATITLKRIDEQELKLTATLGDYPRMVELIQQATFQELWPDYWSRYSRGELLTFGPLSLSVNGIVQGTNSLSWAQDFKLSISGKHLTLKREGKWTAWANVELNDIPNPHLLVALIQESKRIYTSGIHPSESDQDSELTSPSVDEPLNN